MRNPAIALAHFGPVYKRKIHVYQLRDGGPAYAWSTNAYRTCRDAALSALDPLGCQLHDTRAELELARDQVKGLRSALMAIESEVPEHIRQFIREVLA